MKSPTVFLLLFVTSAFAQGTFQNLDFESAVIVPANLPFVQFGPAFPGWTGYIGTNQSSSGVALYDATSLDTSTIGIMDTGWPSLLGVAGPFEGNFAAVLQAGVVGSISNPQDVALSQTGVVPQSAQSLRFAAHFSPTGSQDLRVSLGGQQLSLVALGTANGYTLYGADVGIWAGQSEELSFTVVAQRPYSIIFSTVLDSIEFSSAAIPEPGVLALCAFGGMLLIWRFLRQTRHQLL
jgi:hypothetical protein